MLEERKKTCEKLKAIESTSSHYQKMAEELSDEKVFNQITAINCTL